MADDALEGVQAYNARADASRKTQAYNALSAVYGPIAGDPEAALNLQKYQFNQSNDPLLLQHQGLENTSLGQANAQSAVMDPLLAQHQSLVNAKDQDTNAVDAATQPARIQDTNLKPASTEASIASTQAGTAGQLITNQKDQANLDAYRAQQLRNGTLAIIGGLTDTINQGGDVTATFDKLLPQIKALYPDMPADQLGSLRSAFAQDPVGTANRLQQMMAAGATQPGSSTYNAKAYGKPKSPVESAMAADQMAFIQSRTAAVPGMIASAEALVPLMNPSATIRAAKALIPNTPEYRFTQLVGSIKDSMKLDDLRAMRAAGLSLGRVNMSEFNASANAFGALGPEQNTDDMRKVLDRVSASYNQVNANMDTDIKAMRAGGGRGITGPAASQPGGISTTTASQFIRAAVPGAVIPPHGGYRDAATNKAVHGVPNSMHLRGEALDFVPPGAKWTQADVNKFAAQLDAKHIPHTELFIEDNATNHYHVHWGWGQKGAAAAPDRATLNAKYGL